jgi:hypothetical protein
VKQQQVGVEEEQGAMLFPMELPPIAKQDEADALQVLLA